MKDSLYSQLRSSTHRIHHGPLLPWSLAERLYQDQWLVESSWNPDEEHWELWFGFEEVFVGTCHLQPEAWAMGIFRLNDPEGLLDTDAKESVEKQIARAFFLSLIAHIESEHESTALVEELFDFLVQRRHFGLAARVLKALASKPWRPKAAHIVANYLSELHDTDGEPERALRRVLQEKTRDEVLESIALAFENATIPSTERELTHGGIDGPYVVQHFLGRARSDVEEAWFEPSLHMEDFTYMTSQAVEYYLPPVLRLMMNTPYDDELWIFLRGFLSSRLELSPKQHSAISDWALYLCNDWLAIPTLYELDPDEAKAIARAHATNATSLAP